MAPNPVDREVDRFDPVVEAQEPDSNNPEFVFKDSNRVQSLAKGSGCI